MRSLRMPLAVALTAACAAGPGANPEFGAFWSEFETALAADDSAGVRRMTRFPFLFEGEARDSTAFRGVYDALFSPAARTCLAAATPVPEEDRYVAFCGSYVYYFEAGVEGWRFVEFAADPEAVESGEAGRSVGSWRFAGGRVAPWVSRPVEQLANGGLSGTRIEIAPPLVQASPPLGCGQAELEFVVTPAEGLFQGNLPAPPAAAARALGLERIPALTMRVRCDTGLFDYHHAPGDTLLVALDDVIWKLAPETHAATPGAMIRALLAEHMSGDMGFTPDQLIRKREFLSAPLAAEAAQYFARLDPGNVPPINGDPFTDSQEYPDRFTFGPIAAGASHAEVRVVFSDGHRARPVDFLLVRQDARWLLDDIRYEDGTVLRDLLRR